MLAKLLAWPYSFFVYPIAYLVRDSVRRNKKVLFFLWIVLDDEEDFGEDWWLLEKNLPRDEYWTSWRWAWARNNSWNLNSLLTYKFKKELIVSGYDTSKRQAPLEHCRFKWEIIEKFVDRGGNDAEKIFDGWNVNKGDRLSQKYTNMGRAFCTYTDWYRPTFSPVLWRASYAGIKSGWLINWKLGFNDRGEALIDFKIKRNRSYTDHWS